MTARSFTPCVLTANDLLEGDVVYLAPDGAWTRRLGSARLFVDEAEADAQPCRGRVAAGRNR